MSVPKSVMYAQWHSTVLSNIPPQDLGQRMPQTSHLTDRIQLMWKPPPQEEKTGQTRANYPIQPLYESWLVSNEKVATIKIPITIRTLLQHAPQTLTWNLWENVSLAVQYAPNLCHSILCFFFKPRSAYNNRSALTPERTDEPMYLLVLDE